MQQPGENHTWCGAISASLSQRPKRRHVGDSYTRGAGQHCLCVWGGMNAVCTPYVFTLAYRLCIESHLLLWFRLCYAAVRPKVRPSIDEFHGSGWLCWYCYYITLHYYIFKSFSYGAFVIFPVWQNPHISASRCRRALFHLFLFIYHSCAHSFFLSFFLSSLVPPLLLPCYGTFFWLVFIWLLRACGIYLVFPG